MADFSLFGLRRRLGLTSPQEEADQAERERVLLEQSSRFNPGTALRNRQELLDQLIPQTDGVRAAPVQPVQPVAPPVPAAPAPRRLAPGLLSPAQRALNERRLAERAAPVSAPNFQQQGVRSNINPVIPERSPEDEDRRLRQRSQGGGFVRG